MKIVVAPDSFKESLSAKGVASAIETGLRRGLPDAEIVCVPMADGGEGTVVALVAATDGRYVELTVCDPIGEHVEARYGILGGEKIAVIEMAASSGLALVPRELRQPADTTTFGLGQLMKHAIAQGVATLIVGLGGSGTNDAGAGMAQALGFALRDDEDIELPFGGLALERLHWIDDTKMYEGLKNVEVLAACDVDNPLCGPNGASLVYGPQKGATQEMAERLDAALRHFGELAEPDFGVKVLDVPGAGAAGGLGAGLIAFAHAELRPGVELVAEACGLAGHIEGADLVITGEGRIDGQSVHGKTPVGVAHIARELGVPVVAFAGALGEGHEAVLDEGIERVVAVTPEGLSLEQALPRTAEFLEEAAEALARELV